MPLIRGSVIVIAESAIRASPTAKQQPKAAPKTCHWIPSQGAGKPAVAPNLQWIGYQIKHRGLPKTPKRPPPPFSHQGDLPTLTLTLFELLLDALAANLTDYLQPDHPSKPRATQSKKLLTGPCT